MKLLTKLAGLAIAGFVLCLLLCFLWFIGDHKHAPSVGLETAVPVAATNVESAGVSGTPATNVAPLRPAVEAGAGEQELVGIGAQLVRPNVENGVVQIVRVLPGSPAELAGLKPPLNVHKVDGIALLHLPLSETVRLIRGPVGTKVRLELSEVLQDETFTVELTRQKLEL